MDTSLRPRDIQARIRAGETPADVAAAAGVPVERIAAFSDPVMAERDHVASLARTHPVRRRGETTSHRTLRNVVTDKLVTEGLDADAIEWDAWKLSDRRWRIQVTMPGEGLQRTASFGYDQMGRFSVADDDEAKRLIGDVPAADDLLLVRATQDPGASVHALPGVSLPATHATAVGTDADVAASGGGKSASQDSDQRSARDAHDELEADDAFLDSDLEEVDGVYDLVASPQGDIDVLYDMLSSFDEDSVKIYAGLIHPKEGAPVVEEPPLADIEVVDGNEPTPANPDDEPEQLSLLVEQNEDPKPARKHSKRKRAAVPTWDEIMFGAPRADDQ